MSGITTVLRGSKSVQRTLKDLRGMFETETDVANRIIGTEAVRGVQRNIREQHGPNGEAWPGPPVMRRGRRLQDTRRLLNSITYEAALGSKTVRIGTNVIYAALQHFGGVVTPKRAKMLAIPATPQIRRRYSGSFRRDFPDAFVKTSKKGNLVLVHPKPGARRKGALELIAYLRRSVRIPASPFMGIGAETWARVIMLLEKHVGNVASKAEID